MIANVIPLRSGGVGGGNVDDGEFKLIGAVLELKEKLEIIESSGLAREDFRNSRAAAAWVVIKSMVVMRLEVTAATVASRGARHNMLGAVDGAWLEDLQASNTLTKEQALQIAEDIRVQARSRQVRAQLQEQIDIIDRGRFSPSTAFGALQGIWHSLSTDFSAKETADVDLYELNAQWDDNVKKEQTMLRSTGIRVLDEILGGGVPRNFWIIQGKPGAGKNALLATMIRAKLMADRDSKTPCRIGLFGLESGTQWLVRRWQSEDLSIPLREIGSRKLTQEQWEHKTAHIDPLHEKLLKRVQVFRHNGAQTTELGRLAMQWIFNEGVTDLLVDNFRELKPDPRVRADYHMQVDEMISTFRNIGFRYGVSTGLLIHDIEETMNLKPGEERPPHPDKMQGGKAPGAKSRCTIGIYRKGFSYRASITKNEMGEGRWPDGPTCEFKFNYESATMNPDAGRVVDLRAEKAQDRREQEDSTDVNKLDRDERRAALRAARDAKKKSSEPVAEPKKEAPPAQASLIEVAESKKPESVA